MTVEIYAKLACGYVGTSLRWWRLLVSVLIWSLSGAAWHAHAGDQPVLVAAAANMQAALAELVQQFEKDQGMRITLSIGSSSNLVRQIQQGLPAEIFLSADEDFALQLHHAGLTVDAGLIYGTGRLVLAVPRTSKLLLAKDLQGLENMLSNIEQFAIANPALAPYGKAAAEALRKKKLWSILQGKLVLAENIAQTTQYITTGAAQAGITALSLVKVPEVTEQVRYVLIDESLHTPLRQRMVLLKTARTGARAFYAFLQTPAARAVLLRYGYQ